MSDEGSFDLVDLDAGFDQHAAAKMAASNKQTSQKATNPASTAAQA